VFVRICISAILSFCSIAAAADKWTYVKSGPFEVWTNGSDKHAKFRLLEAEQFRHALTQILGKQELKFPWPVRIIAVKKGASANLGQHGMLERVRDSYLAVVPNEEPLDHEFRRAAARILLDANAKRYPGSVDDGLTEVLADLEVHGTRVSLGYPSQPERRTLAWARMHMMLTDDAFSGGRMRVYLSNLEQGSDEATACRNGFGKSVAEVDGLVKAYAAKSTFESKSLVGRPIQAEKDFYSKTLAEDSARIAEVDAGMSKARSLADLQTAESYETQELYAKAVEAGSKSANAWFRLGLEQLKAGKSAEGKSALQKAAELNPLWADPHAELAKLETIPGRILAEWKLAASLDVRNVGYWEALAVASTKANAFKEAASAWAGAERAAPDDKERARVKQARLDLETQRADYAENERRKASEERYREIERLKAEALGEIRKAEMKTNERLGSDTAPKTTEKWWDGAQGEKVSGTLTRVECLNGPARLWLDNGKKLLIRDPSKIAIVGAKEETLGCGIQKPARKVTVIYSPKTDAKYGTIGDVLQVEFQ
jgi:tetratricopeptide (TPR) repeat protein